MCARPLKADQHRIVNTGECRDQDCSYEGKQHRMLDSREAAFILPQLGQVFAQLRLPAARFLKPYHRTSLFQIGGILLCLRAA